MTHPNPARAAALNRLVEAVGEWRRQHPTQLDALTESRNDERRMIDAYDDLERIPLDLPDDPPRRLAAPLTSHWAAKAMKGNTLNARILTRMYRSSHGWTVEDLEDFFGVTHQSMSPRVNELRNSGWIFADGTTRPNRSGRDAEIYRLTQLGFDTLRAARSQGGFDS